MPIINDYTEARSVMKLRAHKSLLTELKCRYINTDNRSAIPKYTVSVILHASLHFCVMCTLEIVF